MSAEYLRGLEDAAKIADAYADENSQMATDALLSMFGARWREIQQACAGGLDGLAHHATDLVAAKIVHDHDVAAITMSPRRRQGTRNWRT
jgi:hypothetical protein